MSSATGSTPWSTPLQPGDSLRLDFEVRFEPRGFRNGGSDAVGGRERHLLHEQSWLPAIGYQPERELAKRQRPARRTGSPPRPLLASRSTIESAQGSGRARADRRSRRSSARTRTDRRRARALRRTWTEGGRRYFHYATDAPIGNEYAFFSADYAVHEAHGAGRPVGPGQETSIQIFHHPKHAANLDRMLRSVQASLDYYTGEFGPYPYRQIRVVERPGDSARRCTRRRSTSPIRKGSRS